MNIKYCSADVDNVQYSTIMTQTYTILFD